VEHIIGILKATVSLWLEMGPYLIFGFALAGVLQRFFSPSVIARHLGQHDMLSVAKASIFGVPLPLCSCSVIPVGLSLHDRGASRGAATSFLISTPQTGVDSIAITYGMLGPMFAILRPIVAFVNGMLGGFIVAVLDRRDERRGIEVEPESQAVDESDGCEDGCSTIKEEVEHLTFGQHAWRAFRYAFLDFPREIAGWLVIGILIAGLVAYILPADQQVLAKYLGTGFLPMAVMAVAGIPFYICATASVPFVAVLIAEGLSPGAALVFMMTGPATNAATVVLLLKTLGKRMVTVYLGSILFCAFVFGYGLDLVYAAISGMPGIKTAHVHEESSWINILGGVALFVVVGVSLARNFAYKFRKSINTQTIMENARELRVEGMTCQNCAMHVEQAAASVEGVESAVVDLDGKKVRIGGVNADMQAIADAIKKAGYEPKTV
jgi:hypothetical protein